MTPISANLTTAEIAVLAASPEALRILAVHYALAASQTPKDSALLAPLVARSLHFRDTADQHSVFLAGLATDSPRAEKALAADPLISAKVTIWQQGEEDIAAMQREFNATFKASDVLLHHDLHSPWDEVEARQQALAEDFALYLLRDVLPEDRADQDIELSGLSD